MDRSPVEEHDDLYYSNELYHHPWMLAAKEAVTTKRTKGDPLKGLLLHVACEILWYDLRGRPRPKAVEIFARLGMSRSTAHVCLRWLQSNAPPLPSILSESELAALADEQKAKSELASQASPEASPKPRKRPSKPQKRLPPLYVDELSLEQREMLLKRAVDFSESMASLGFAMCNDPACSMSHAPHSHSENQTFSPSLGGTGIRRWPRQRPPS